ncbi:hypothetical protein TNCV_52311 [Trichonephila clavipes]|nr:hypothetical protein TNCV_52311 [Trichonephila clavipes]
MNDSLFSYTLPDRNIGRKCARDYGEKLSDRPDSETAWNYFRSERFLACYVSSRQLQVFERFLQLKEQVSRTPHFLCESRRNPCSFKHQL